MSNATLTQFFYTEHKMPVLIDVRFTLDVANVNGLGISSFKGKGVSAVYGHTSATPAAGNPNPPAGYFLIKLRNNYNRSFVGMSGIVTQNSGANINVTSTGVTANLVYVITVLGTVTTAGWQSLGLPIGITPAVGVAFVATATTTVAGAGMVQIPSATGAGITAVEFVGDGSTTLISSGIGRSSPYIMLRTMGPTSAGSTVPLAVNPADGSMVAIKLYLSNSSVMSATE